MDRNQTAGGWTALVGGTLFEFGGYMMVLESLNRNHEVVCACTAYETDPEVCFGHAVHQHCTHLFHNRSRRNSDSEQNEDQQKWRWFGARWGEIGFIASSIQFVAATIFWISTITGIPGVINMENTGLVDGIFWAPQVIGGSGFIIARYSILHIYLLWVQSCVNLKCIVHVGNSTCMVSHSAF
jgi:hypothetical protein